MVRVNNRNISIILNYIYLTNRKRFFKFTFITLTIYFHRFRKLVVVDVRELKQIRGSLIVNFHSYLYLIVTGSNLKRSLNLFSSEMVFPLQSSNFQPFGANTVRGIPCLIAALAPAMSPPSWPPHLISAIGYNW